MQENPLFNGLFKYKIATAFTIVIFGASGDLTAKKLIPALYSLFSHGFISNFKIIGFARSKWDSKFFKEKITDILKQHPVHSADTTALPDFINCISYISAPYDTDEGYELLKQRTAASAQVVYYLATPPVMYEPVIARLGSNNLSRYDQKSTKIVVEKPFGYDLASAEALNSHLLSIFDEKQVYRIDHYLGKETVQNIMVYRFGNGIYEPIWNSNYIEHVQITVAEKSGIGGRGSYYENAGAIRDMLQNHLLQLLSLVAMEAPNDLQPDSIRNEKLKVLKAIRPIDRRSSMESLVRAQYGGGIIDGETVKSYREEHGVAPDSETETYVGVKLFIDTWRWSGVPFFLRTGKRLSRRSTEISIQFKTPPHLLFGRDRTAQLNPNSLTLAIQPDEGITFRFNSKIPGFDTKMRTVNMSFSYGSSFAEKSPEAYERLLLDVMLGDNTLFTRNDEIECAWRFISNLITAYREEDKNRLLFYPAGGAGPEEADMLINRYGIKWRKL
jgi:glucose-6-phosphate 1-dehydrogenase